jgi:hypothetical protein
MITALRPGRGVVQDCVPGGHPALPADQYQYSGIARGSGFSRWRSARRWRNGSPRMLRRGIEALAPGGSARERGGRRDRREPHDAGGGGALARQPGSTANRHTAGTRAPAPPTPAPRRTPVVSPGAACARTAGFPTSGNRSSCCLSMTAPRAKDIRRPADPCGPAALQPVCGVPPQAWSVAAPRTSLAHDARSAGRGANASSQRAAGRAR